MNAKKGALAKADAPLLFQRDGLGADLIMPEINCPKCGESNPADCVICWACYAPLIRHSARAVSPRPRAKRLGDAILNGFVPLLLAGLLSSGWLARRARWPVLGASLSGLLALIAAEQWSNRKSTALIQAQLEPEPAVRWHRELLLYAQQQGATAVRLTENGADLKPFYRLNGQWREGTPLPLVLWFPMRHLSLQCARTGEFERKGNAGGAPHDFAFRLTGMSAHLVADARGETLEVRFESAPPARTEALPALASGVRCKCNELNAPGAVWCWNCYAPLQASRARAWRPIVEGGLAISVLGALGSSGWWPRRARPFVLGAGALGSALALVWCPLQERFKDFRIGFLAGKRDDTTEAEKPVERLIDQILARLAQVGANQIQLQERGGVIVSFANEGESREKMLLPPYVWLALRGRLLEIARSGARVTDGQHTLLRAELSSDVSGETLILRFETRD